ncbi:GNAT family N-acetyltransferase [Acidipila sp. EB88]|uniref:GNAT family N-acetyltransferase n=1 Tax=Acidipila sp. EB88 TaxID=2305226 RepID=UPI000F5FCE57|nr:GNAT family N-acetyltransferase [Acidipila sp. EB88]
MESEFRFAMESDVAAITSLVNVAYQVEKFFKIGERTHEGEIRGLLARGRFLLFENATDLVACVYLEVRGERGYVGMLSVSPAHQRQGIAARIMAAGEEFCREMGCHFMDLSVVNLRTELPPIYAKFGYQVTGSAPFPADEMPVKLPCSFVLMSKPLMEQVSAGTDAPVGREGEAPSGMVTRR